MILCPDSDDDSVAVKAIDDADSHDKDDSSSGSDDTLAVEQADESDSGGSDNYSDSNYEDGAEKNEQIAKSDSSKDNDFS